MKVEAADGGRSMTFRNYGGLYQLEVKDERDLGAIDKLDRARWAATSAPVADFQVADPAFLAILDPDKRGRVRPADVVAARDWLYERLAIRQRLAERTDSARLGDLNAGTPGGARLKKAPEHVLKELDAKERGAISLDQVRSFRTSYVGLLANGDGVVPPEAI